MIRGLELLEMGEEPAPEGEDSRLWTAELRQPTLLAGLTMEREGLYARIDARVAEMVAAGPGEEVRRADAAGASRPRATRSASRSCCAATWTQCSAGPATTRAGSSPGCAAWA